MAKAFIKTIEPQDAEGELLEIYENLIKTRGKIAEVHKIQSLNPKTITAHMDLYMAIMFGKSPIDRVQREMMAVVVSKANECEYCQIHHIEAVDSFWNDQERTTRLKKDYNTADLSDREFALCDYAEKLTLSPGESREKEYVKDLKSKGFTDREILDATLVISYFNFVNRIVQSLGVEVEADPGGYKYE